MTTDQTALPSSSSSSSPTRWKYDVFLCFHGEDTRKSFTAHLYTALEQKGIYTFRDDEKLERGQYISLELLKAIKESKYAIIGTFAEAFVKHGEDPDIHKKIQTWRVALKEVGNIAGWHLHDRDESTAIQEITGKILGRLNRKCSNVSEELFGIDSPIDQTRNLLKKNSDGVCFVGICGMGGIGKDANDIVGLVLCASFSVPDRQVFT
ncbi:hypothetical protein I3760_14G037200 [Carya illinoinensis]|nr:hypothetical protein I3760_14G037200 [Carya illinoinensis]